MCVPWRLNDVISWDLETKCSPVTEDFLTVNCRSLEGLQTINVVLKDILGYIILCTDIQLVLRQIKMIFWWCQFVVYLCRPHAPLPLLHTNTVSFDMNYALIMNVILGWKWKKILCVCVCSDLSILVFQLTSIRVTDVIFTKIKIKEVWI